MTGLFKIRFKVEPGMRRHRHFQGKPRPCDWDKLLDHTEVQGVDRITSIQHYDGKPNENRTPLNAEEMLKLWKAVFATTQK